MGAMKLRLIREGSKGPLVLAWEEFLRDELCYMVEADGFFDENTVLATKDFQARNGLQSDGWVGNQTWGKALQVGFAALDDDTEGDARLSWPPPPSFGPLSYAAREGIFGHIAFREAPTESNPEAIQITNDFTRHITTIVVPELARVQGILSGPHVVGRGPKSGKVALHEKAAQPMLDLWKRWDEAGLLGRVLTWAGMWVPRFVRGSRTTLSNHAYGTAFDINAPWNGLRRTPALVGQKGCVRELVPHANELGWYWGGHFSRKDGMHFEYVGS